MPKQKLPEKDFDWVPKLAYAVGLLVTDGCLSNDRRHIVMRSSETEMLENFKNCLSLKNKVGLTPSDGGYRVQFGNVQFYNWLLKIGFFPAKTYTIGAIEIPDEYFRDFVRGHLDGDGNIRLYEDRYNTYRNRVYVNRRLFVRFVSASPTHIQWLQQKIHTLAQLKGALMKSNPRDNKHVPLWTLKFSKAESVQLLNWIYYNANLPTLQRKQLLATKALQTIAVEKRKEYARIIT